MFGVPYPNGPNVTQQDSAVRRIRLALGRFYLLRQVDTYTFWPNSKRKKNHTRRNRNLLMEVKTQGGIYIYKQNTYTSYDACGDDDVISMIFVHPKSAQHA